MKTELSSKLIKREITMSAGAANVYSLIFLVPLVLVLVIPYYLLWPDQFSNDSMRTYLEAREMMTFLDSSIIFLYIIIGVVSHELLHGIGWSYYAKNGWKSINFGIVWKYLTPYCHCSEPLLITSYRFGSILPAIVLGIVPYMVAVTIGNIWLMVFGFFFTLAAGGDFLILWQLRKEKNTCLVKDHPNQIGCIVFQE